VADGRTDRDIADELVISVSTVRSHLDRVREKTGLRRRSELTRMAIEEGITG
jgi:DNA-binding NarL/FixJ family response regulator